ncbi:uncharacterized protein METZ01_LOCUS367442 [marine metagenome]|uniref:Uncharacterized protein n=1 Tax=marine metagenome TaxID=408172 RepID=A0A382SZJ7_9ZZZZ
MLIPKPRPAGFFVCGMMGGFGNELHRNDIKQNNYIE